MLKKAIKSLFSSLGYELKNKNYKDIFTVRNTMEESLEQIKSTGFYPDLVIDVGVADGTTALQETFSNAEFLWVEPLQEFEKSLQELQKKYKGNYLLAALGRESGELEIKMNPDKVGSSILEDSADGGQEKENRKIPVYTLKSIADERLAGFKNILLKIDVQGYEQHVMEGAGDFLNKIDVIILEVSFFRFYKGGPDFYDIVQFMRQKGFVVYDIFGGIYRPADFALAQKDLVFVKNAGRFRSSHSFI